MRKENWVKTRVIPAPKIDVVSLHIAVIDSTLGQKVQDWNRFGPKIGLHSGYWTLGQNRGCTVIMVIMAPKMDVVCQNRRSRKTYLT